MRRGSKAGPMPGHATRKNGKKMGNKGGACQRCGRGSGEKVRGRVRLEGLCGMSRLAGGGLMGTGDAQACLD